LYDILKKIFFKFEAETAHNISMFFLKILNEVPKLNLYSSEHFVLNEKLHQEINGINFLNPVGMGAGFDKNAEVIKALATFGFGFTEVGTITPNPQLGNPKPRIFRHIDEHSLQNALGFNNCGSKIIKQRLKEVYPFSTPIGINVGKNANVPEKFALDDYLDMVKYFNNLGDYISMNLSSPNTKNLRDLQNSSFVSDLFSKAKELTNKPMFLKISPDLSPDDAIKISLKAIESGASGIIATNTTNDYSVVNNAMHLGGISGMALKEKSFTLFKEVAKEVYKKGTLISVGGIDSAEEAYRRIKHGASLVQLYTAFIYQGYHIAKNINLGLLELLKKDGYDHISQAIGKDL
jgi:dihydroorotate dehydrogenase